MSELTSRERFQRMYDHKEADRVPMVGTPWDSTLERWRAEGMPEDVPFSEYFGLDHFADVGGDIFSSDHSIPDSVSIENYTNIVWLAKELGSYSTCR